MPFGILNVSTGVAAITSGSSRETGDFRLDCLLLWRGHVKCECGHVRRSDNGLGNDRRWHRRLVEFAGATGLEVGCVYYAPYHGKYNPTERAWGGVSRKSRWEIRVALVDSVV